MCLDDTMFASWSLTHEVAGSNPFNDNHFSVEFSKVIFEKLKHSYVPEIN